MNSKVLGKVFIDITEEDARDFLDSKTFVDWRFPVYDKNDEQIGEIDIVIGRNVKDPHDEEE